MYFKFENLEIWQLARMFTAEIYQLTQKFPREEIFGLTNQIRRASVSTVLNIAEGSNRTQVEFCRFLNIALTSLEEVVTGLYLAKDQKFITTEDFNIYYEKSNILAAKITSLINIIKNNSNR